MGINCVIHMWKCWRQNNDPHQTIDKCTQTYFYAYLALYTPAVLIKFTRNSKYLCCLTIKLLWTLLTRFTCHQFCAAGNNDWKWKLMKIVRKLKALRSNLTFNLVSFIAMTMKERLSDWVINFFPTSSLV